MPSRDFMTAVISFRLMHVAVIHLFVYKDRQKVKHGGYVDGDVRYIFKDKSNVYILK